MNIPLWCMTNHIVIFDLHNGSNPHVLNAKFHELQSRYRVEYQNTSCNEIFSVKDFLIDCVEFSDNWKQYLNIRHLKQLFTEVPVSNILSILKTINIYNKI